MSNSIKKKRLDILLFEKGLTSESREKARALIMAGNVYVNGQREIKPGASFSDDAEIELRGEKMPFVSRGGLKLEKALQSFKVSPEGLTCVDCGASTGGFTDCLLKAGAVKVYAVDVGYGQLDWRIRNDPRVVTMERTNIRYVTSVQIPDKPSLAVIDVSFISLRLVLPALRGFLAEDGQVICLVKPQFEAGREKVGKKGVVRDRNVHIEVLRRFLGDAKEAGFTPISLDYSPIRGPEGNIEYLAHLAAGETESAEPRPESVAEAAHSAF